MPCTRTRYRLALSVLADYEHTRGGQLVPCEILGALWAERVTAGQSRSTLWGYVSAARAPEDLELPPRVVCPLHWRMARAGKPTPGQPYIGSRGLVALWARASTPIEQAVAALAMLSVSFLRVSEAATITPTDLANEKFLWLCLSKVGDFQHLGRLVHPLCAV